MLLEIFSDRARKRGSSSPLPRHTCIFLLPQCIYSLSQPHHTHNIISELLHPQHHPWYAFPLACIFKLSLLSPFSYLSSVCFSSFQNYLMVLSSILFFSSPLEKELGGPVSSLPCLPETSLIYVPSPGYLKWGDREKVNSIYLEYPK